MKYLELYQDYIYKQYNMTRKKPANVTAIVFAVIIIFALVVFNIKTPTKIYAEKKQEASEIKKYDFVTEIEIEDAKRREEVAKQAWYEASIKEQEEDIARRAKELKENFTVGDWIIITWWREIKNGPDAPKGESRTGQIQKIIDDRIYGTWGDSLIYGKDHWHRCSQKEYLEARKDEQLKKDRKAKKKKFVSLGLYPGTVKSNGKTK